MPEPASDQLTDEEFNQMQKLNSRYLTTRVNHQIAVRNCEEEGDIIFDYGLWLQQAMYLGLLEYYECQKLQWYLVEQIPVGSKVKWLVSFDNPDPSSIELLCTEVVATTEQSAIEEAKELICRQHPQFKKENLHLFNASLSGQYHETTNG